VSVPFVLCSTNEALHNASVVAALSEEFKKAVDQYIDENKVIIFIKGSKVRAEQVARHEQSTGSCKLSRATPSV
jgi:hypothetical protein